MNLSRRGFLGGLIAALSVPAAVKLNTLEAVTPELITSDLVIPDYLWVARFDIFQHMFAVNAIAREKAIARVSTGAFRALPEDTCHLLTDRYGRFCRPDSELELVLKPEEMGLPDFGSLVPQRQQNTWGRFASAIPDLRGAEEIQRQIDGEA